MVAEEAAAAVSLASRHRQRLPHTRPRRAAGRSAKAVTFHRKAQAEAAAETSKVCTWASADRRLAEEERPHLPQQRPHLPQ